MGDEEPVSQQPPADEEQDQTAEEQGTDQEEPGTDQEGADKPETPDTPGDITPESHYPGG
jgi:hypothetical protein